MVILQLLAGLAVEWRELLADEVERLDLHLTSATEAEPRSDRKAEEETESGHYSTTKVRVMKIVAMAQRLISSSSNIRLSPHIQNAHNQREGSVPNRNSCGEAC